MKDSIHPPYQEILFVDTATGFKFVCGSTLQPKETDEFEGKEYPVYRAPISSASHPFFTKSNQFIDTEGRVEKFTKRYAKRKDQAKKEQEKQQEKPLDKKEEKKTKPKEAVKKTVTKKTTEKKTVAKKSAVKKTLDKKEPKK